MVQGGGRCDVFGERGCAFGERCGFGKRREAAPVHGSAFIRRGVDVVAQCGTQSCFVALRDLELIDERRPEFAAADLARLIAPAVAGDKLCVAADVVEFDGIDVVAPAGRRPAAGKRQQARGCADCGESAAQVPQLPADGTTASLVRRAVQRSLRFRKKELSPPWA